MTLFTAKTPPKRSRCDDGVAAIEFALLSPILVILLVGLVEIGFACYQAMQAQSAAEAGAIYASKHGWDVTGIQSAVVGATGAAAMAASPSPRTFCGCPELGGITETSCTFACVGGSSPGRYVEVNAALNHQTILPYPWLTSPLVLKGKATMRLN